MGWRITKKARNTKTSNPAFPFLFNGHKTSGEDVSHTHTGTRPRNESGFVGKRHTEGRGVGEAVGEALGEA